MSSPNRNWRWSYAPNGVSTSFAFDNLVLDASDLAVTWYSSTGAELSLPSWSVTGIGNPLGGTVVFSSAPATVANSLIVIQRTTSKLQQGEFADFVSPRAATQEKRADQPMLTAQEAYGLLMRAILLHPLDNEGPFYVPPAALRAGKAVLFGPLPDALPVVGNALDPGNMVVSAFVEQMLDDADAPAVLGTLGFSTFMKGLRATDDADALLEALGFTTYFRSTLLALTDAASWRAALTEVSQTLPLIDNAACQVKQQAGTTNLTTSPQHAKVDRFSAWASGGSVSAGTIGQNTAATIGRAGYSLQLAGVTLTGSGKVSVRHRMEAAQARHLRNTNVSFGVAVLHDCTGPINYVVTFRKPTVEDDFTSTTFIANSAGQSVATGAGDRVTFDNQAIGDVSKGLEIEITAECGAVTTRNFEFTEFTIASAASVPPFVPLRGFADMLAACQRFWEAGHSSYDEAYVDGSWSVEMVTQFKATKRAVPTCTVSAGAMDVAYTDCMLSIIAVASAPFHVPFTWTADARFAP